MTLDKPKQKYTYQDYLTWSDGERWEIIESVPYNMSPAPRRSHQDVSLNVAALMKMALKGKKCIPYIAPTDVVLDDENVVQPDVFVVCDPKKLTEKGIFGAPDVIFEILSPSSTQKDRWIKKRLYERFGVKEYIIIDIEAQYAERFLLQEDGTFNQGEDFGIDSTIVIQPLDQLKLSMQDILELPITESEPNAAG
jgi:Uma2 family endonuclease